MVFVHQRGRRSLARIFRPCRGLPVVLRFLRWYKAWHELNETLGKGVKVRFVELAKLRELLIGFGSVRKRCSVFCQSLADQPQHFGREPILLRRQWGNRKNLAKVDYGVSGNRKRKLRLPRTNIFHTRNREGATIQDRRQRTDPRLVVVLRTKVRQHRIGEMAFKNLSGPPLPILEQLAQLFV